MLKILPYKLGSVSAKELAKTLNVKRIRPNGSYRPKSSTLVLNWGNSRAFHHARMLNKPEAISVASNKLKALQALKSAGVTTPDFTTNKDEAALWQQKGYRVVCRTLLNSHSGKGIIIVQPEEQLPYAPLYTKYTKKEKEYRVHVFNGKVIDVCEKRKRNGSPEGNSLVRTLNNGWVYCREGVVLPEAAKNLSLSSVKALGLDFGAVDLICRSDKFYVLEVNTAPGVTGTTLQRYAQALKELMATRNIWW